MKFDVVIVGAGVIGLAIARVFAKNNFKTLLVEKNKSFGKETSSRNSGVIHAGIYYPPDSLKSKFCKEGNKLLYQYLDKKKIFYKKCGKLIISSNKEEDLLIKSLMKNAKKSGTNLIYKDKYQTSELEPQLCCYSSIFSPNTGVVDVHDLMFNFETDIHIYKGMIVYNTEVDKIFPDDHSINFTIKNAKKKFKTKFLINSTGLNSHIVARKILDYNKKLIPKIIYYKGSYFKLSGKSPFNHLIYPVPKINSLGIHSTININNQTIFGPDEEKVNNINYFLDERKKKFFIDQIKKYWPDITKNKLEADYCGIRTTSENNDFVIQSKQNHNIQGLINLFGINSPGLTSSMAIADYIFKNTINQKY